MIIKTRKKPQFNFPKNDFLVQRYFYPIRVKKKIFDFRNLNKKFFKFLSFVHSSRSIAHLYPSRKFWLSSSLSFYSRFSRQLLYLSTRVGSYSAALSKVREGDKVVSRFKYSVFGYRGLHARKISFRNRYFFKRRAIFNFFKYNLYSANSPFYLSSTNFFSSLKLRLHIRQTKNNLFLFLRHISGRLIFIYTNGQTIYKGSRRATTSAADLAGKQVSKFLSINKVPSVCLVFDTPLTSIVKAAVRGLSTSLEFSGILSNKFTSHNGMKIRATRRV